MLNTLLELLAFALVVLGVYLLAGGGWAVLAAGALLGVYVELNGYLAARSSS